jgi:hypothetical protein
MSVERGADLPYESHGIWCTHLFEQSQVTAIYDDTLTVIPYTTLLSAICAYSLPSRADRRFGNQHPWLAELVV